MTTLTGLIKNYTNEQANNIKYKKVKYKRLYFLKSKNEDKIYEYNYIKEIPDHEFNTEFIINKIIKKLRSINTYDNKNLLIEIYNDVVKTINDNNKITNQE